jgi:type II secretory pathway pseudopilin PulG
MTELQQKKTLGIAVASLVLGCLVLIPLLGLLFSIAALVLGIVALVKISKNKDTLKGSGLAIAGIVLGGIGIIMLPIIAILAAIAIPSFLNARTNAYDSAAQATVRTISTALESYAADNNGKYPVSEDELVKASPPYLTQSYNASVISGHKFSLSVTPDSYEVTAIPVDCYRTGKQIIKAKTKGEISEEACTYQRGR